MKQAAPESKKTAGGTEQDAHRRSADHIAGMGRCLPTKVMPAQRQRVEAYQDISQVGPGIGLGAQNII